MSDVVRFPPLPAVPTPVGFEPDERQRAFARITAALTSQLCDGDFTGSVVNTGHGFRASAIDLGILQTHLNHGLARFSMEQIRERWDDDVMTWICMMIRSWVQRCKEMHFDVRELGIHIILETQDDKGYYKYEFDAFPGRAGVVE